LAAIAYPSYQEYTRKTKRVDAQAEMVNIAGQLQRYKIVNFKFLKSDGTAIELDDIGRSEQLPPSGTALYNLALSNVTAGTWTLTATPIELKQVMVILYSIIVEKNAGRKALTKIVVRLVCHQLQPTGMVINS
jgi:Tfp pilus assembly protein PilE